MKPPYDAPYWDTLTPAQRINDLVHKMAQRHAMTYPQAYATAAAIINEDGQETYAARLFRAGRVDEAIAALVAWHTERTPPCLT
jgi:hypothetical protein